MINDCFLAIAMEGGRDFFSGSSSFSFFFSAPVWSSANRSSSSAIPIIAWLFTNAS